MPITETYTTEAEVKAYMAAQLGAVLASACGWLDVNHAEYQTAVNNLLRAGRVATVDLLPGATIELLATVEIWRRVVNQFTLAVNFSADGLSASQEALFQHAKDRLAAAEAAAAPYYRTGPPPARSTVHPTEYIPFKK
jgi:hypothetical protein